MSESRKRTYLVRSILNFGGFAMSVENVCFKGCPDVYGETKEGEPFWIECKLAGNKLSPSQIDFFKISKIQKYTVTFLKKLIILHDMNTNVQYEYTKLHDVTKHILKIKQGE